MTVTPAGHSAESVAHVACVYDGRMPCLWPKECAERQFCGRVGDGESVPSKRAVLDSITYLERTLWPSVNETVKAHLAGIRQFVAAAHIDGHE